MSAQDDFDPTESSPFDVKPLSDMYLFPPVLGSNEHPPKSPPFTLIHLYHFLDSSMIHHTTIVLLPVLINQSVSHAALNVHFQ
jgi:hypothetical protein